MNIIRHHFTTIDSTNTWAKHHADTFDRQAITLITADMQTAGRGRFKRQWVSPPKENIYASYCIFLEKHRLDSGNMPQVAAISIVEILSVLGFKPKLKWPNDVTLSNKKIAGILSESTPLSDQLCLIIGIGLNVNMPLETLQMIDKPATSLCVEAKERYEVGLVLDMLTQKLVENFQVFLEEGFHPFIKSYRSLLWMPETPIQFNDNRTTHSGVIQSVNDDGSINVLLQDGKVQTFHAGEIVG